MPAQNGQNPTPNRPNDADYQKLVQQVAERVWKLWQQELKQTQERSGGLPTTKKDRQP